MLLATEEAYFSHIIQEESCITAAACSAWIEFVLIP